MFYMRVPQAFWVVEVNPNGDFLTDPIKLNGVGWGEYDDMVSSGPGRLVWTYITNPAVERVRPDKASSSNTVQSQKAAAPNCAREKGSVGNEPVAFQTAVYTQSSSPSVRATQCNAPADGQPVCSRLVPPLKTSSSGCGGPGGWELATGLCSQEALGRLKSGATNSGSRGQCGPLGGGVTSGPIAVPGCRYLCNTWASKTTMILAGIHLLIAT